MGGKNDKIGTFFLMEDQSGKLSWEKKKAQVVNMHRIIKIESVFRNKERTLQALELDYIIWENCYPIWLTMN